MKQTTLFLFFAVVLVAADPPKLSEAQKLSIREAQLAAAHAQGDLLALEKDPEYQRRSMKLNEAVERMKATLASIRKALSIGENCQITETLDVKCEEKKEAKK